MVDRQTRREERKEKIIKEEEEEDKIGGNATYLIIRGSLWALLPLLHTSTALYGRVTASCRTIEGVGI